MQALFYRAQSLGLIEKQAAGWLSTTRHCDHGISGAKGRAKRPAFDAMCKAAARREFDIVMAWSVD